MAWTYNPLINRKLDNIGLKGGGSIDGYRPIGTPITTTPYTFVLTDANKYIEINQVVPATIVVPENATVAFPVGTEIEGRNAGLEIASFSPAGAVVINNAGLLDVVPAGYWYLKKVATDEWDLAVSFDIDEYRPLGISIITTPYTFVLDDENTYIEINQVVPATIVVPENATVAFPVGTEIEGRNAGLEIASFSPAGAVVINNAGSLDVAPAGYWYLKKVATDEWDLAVSFDTVGSIKKRRFESGNETWNPSILTDEYLIVVDNTTLPGTVIISTEDVQSGSSSIPRFFVIKDEKLSAATNNITISLENGGTIEGEASIALVADGAAIEIYCDGVNAWIL